MSGEVPGRRYLVPVGPLGLSGEPDDTHLAVLSWNTRIGAWLTGVAVCGRSATQGELADAPPATCESCLFLKAGYEEALSRQAIEDPCECGRGPVVGLLTVTASRVLFRTADEGSPAHDQGAADLRCLNCVADAVAEVASGEFRKRMREAGRRDRGAA